MNWIDFGAAAFLAFIHFMSSRLRFLDAIPRSRWLSVAGGVAVAYAILFLLPELEKHQEAFADVLFVGERGVYALTLLGLIGFYGLEKLARGDNEDEQPSNDIFWVHIASYGLYNLIIGYLIVREDREFTTLALYVIGIGLHFVVNDHGLRTKHRERYRRSGRWILSATILVGWGIGTATKIHSAVTAAFIAIVAGGVLLNTFKEELPEERESRFVAFSAGAFLYAGILLLS